MSKPKVLVCILTGIERQNWICADLSINLVQMARDSRFTVNYFPVRDARPWDTARNITVRMARELNVDWILSFDNDNFMQCNPLDIIAAAGKDKHVIGVDYGGGSCAGIITQNDGRHGYAMFSHMSPPVPNGAIDGPFKEVNHVPGGVLMIRNTVWQQIPGPWFVWVRGDGELLLDNSCHEDIYFCNLVRQHGFKVWKYQQPAGHYRTTDITGMVCTLAQLTEQAKGAQRT